MKYYDRDYSVNKLSGNKLSDDDEIIDVYFVRKPHYCAETDEFWDSNQDESLYMKIRNKFIGNSDKIVCLAKNMVNEYEMYFENDREKSKFFEVEQNDKFYNKLDLYTCLNDKQTCQLLKILSEHGDSSIYKFQNCDNNRVIYNIILDNLIFGSKEVEKNYDVYLKSLKENCDQQLESLFQEIETKNNVVDFYTRK